jgi:hypothetical protein
LLAIVTISPLFASVVFGTVKKSEPIEKNCSPLWRCAVVRQMIEIPGDLVIERACGAGRAQRIINLNN